MDENPNQLPQSAKKLPAPKRPWWAWPKIGRLVGLIVVVLIASFLGLIGTVVTVDYIDGPRPHKGFGQQEWDNKHEWQFIPTIIGGLAIGGFAGWSIFSLLSNRVLPKK